MLKSWINQVFPERTFHNHFQLDHQFHGIDQNLISETFIIRPKSSLGLQLLIDGVQITDTSLHLRSKILVHSDSIKINIHVIDPNESQVVLRKLKKKLVKQVLAFEKRFYSSPMVQYVEKFCNQCVYNNTKPRIQCIASCRFQPHSKENLNEMTSEPNQWR